MKIRLLVSHPFNNRPKIRMARVDGCTFFLKREKKMVGRETVVGEPMWMHAGLCKNAAHHEKVGVADSDERKEFVSQANAEIATLLAAK